MNVDIAHQDDLLVVGWLREAEPWRSNFRPRQILSSNSSYVLYGRRIRRVYVALGAFDTPRAEEFFAVLEPRLRSNPGSDIRPASQWAADQQADLDELNAAFEREMAKGLSFNYLKAFTPCVSETSA